MMAPRSLRTQIQAGRGEKLNVEEIVIHPCCSFNNAVSLYQKCSQANRFVCVYFEQSAVAVAKGKRLESSPKGLPIWLSSFSPSVCAVLEDEQIYFKSTKTDVIPRWRSIDTDDATWWCEYVNKERQNNKERSGDESPLCQKDSGAEVSGVVTRRCWRKQKENCQKPSTGWLESWLASEIWNDSETKCIELSKHLNPTSPFWAAKIGAHVCSPEAGGWCAGAAIVCQTTSMTAWIWKQHTPHSVWSWCRLCARTLTRFQVFASVWNFFDYFTSLDWWIFPF